MNLYFLVEGDVTESLVYPAWITHLLPHHRRVQRPQDADENCFYLLSGHGYPQILQEIPNAVENIRTYKSFRYLVICADVEDDDPEAKARLVRQKLDESPAKLPSTSEFYLILQQRCMESWFLGNRTVFPQKPNSPILRDYIEHYNVYDSCPEEMGQHEDFLTHAAFHFAYLRLIFKERGRAYSKKNPDIAKDADYLARLIDRTEATGHLSTFRSFYSLCRTIRGYCPIYAMSSKAE